MRGGMFMGPSFAIFTSSQAKLKQYSVFRQFWLSLVVLCLVSFGSAWSGLNFLYSCLTLMLDWGGKAVEEGPI